MRSDMAKVLTERPRAGMRTKTPKGTRRYYARLERDDMMPKRERIRERWQRTYNEKGFTDLIGPLWRFLRSRVGQRWDDVYSEICAHINPSSLQQIHLLDHVKGMVCTNVVLLDGVPYEYSNYGLLRVVSPPGREYFYVCPESGRLLLSPTEPFPRYHRPTDPTWCWKNRQKLTQYRLHKGIWYEVQLAPLPETVLNPPQYNYWENGKLRVLRHLNPVIFSDIFVRDAVLYDANFFKRTYGGPYYAIRKQQIDKRTIVANKLRDKKHVLEQQRAG